MARWQSKCPVCHAQEAEDGKAIYQVERVRMGNTLKTGLRTVQRFNAENRAHRLMDKDKIRTAPRHPSTAKAIKQLQDKHPEVLTQQQLKDDKLLGFLRNIRVESTDPKPTKVIPETSDQNDSIPKSNRLLPTTRVANPESSSLFVVPDQVPQGRLSVPMAIEMLAKHKQNPKEWTVERLASSYKLDLTDAKNILEYFRSFKVIPIDITTHTSPARLVGR